MAIDRLLEKSWQGVVLALIALIAYFHATLATNLLAFALSERPLGPSSRAESAKENAAPRTQSSADATLGRRPASRATPNRAQNLELLLNRGGTDLRIAYRIK